jgi:putative membrane protein
MPKIKFTEADKKTVSTAVAKAETTTSGEIAVAVIKESYDYAIYETVTAVLGGFLYFIILMFYVAEIQTFLQHLFWDYTVNYLLLFYGFSTFVVITLLYFLFNISSLDRLIVPLKVRNKKVRERAIRYFMESGVSNTRDRTGILIFISLLERRVELLADSGISQQISQEKWDAMIDDIISGIKQGELVAHLNKAIADCGSLLQEFFPIKEDDTNELSDEVQILEK